MVVLRVLVVLFVMAGLADRELARQRVVVRVPVARVSPAVCDADGGIKGVTEHPIEPGVFAVTCGDGVRLVAGNR